LITEETSARVGVLEYLQQNYPIVLNVGCLIVV